MPPHEQEMRKKHLEILRRTWKELPPAEQKRLLEMTPEAREKHLAKFLHRLAGGEARGVETDGRAPEKIGAERCAHGHGHSHSNQAGCQGAKLHGRTSFRPGFSRLQERQGNRR